MATRLKYGEVGQYGDRCCVDEFIVFENGDIREIRTTEGDVVARMERRVRTANAIATEMVLPEIAFSR